MVDFPRSTRRLQELWRHLAAATGRRRAFIAVRREGHRDDGDVMAPKQRTMAVFSKTNTLWLFNIAMGNGPFIGSLPIKDGDFPWLCYVK